jgi:hypothetical protein
VNRAAEAGTACRSDAPGAATLLRAVDLVVATTTPVARRAESPSSKPRRRRATRPARHTPTSIVGKIREWATTYGAPPTMRDWEPSRARRTNQAWRAERYEAGDWPSAKAVQLAFGTFNAAIAATGFEPNAGTGPPKRPLTGPDQVVAEIVEWTRRYGDPPSQADWDTARARRLGQPWRIERYRSEDWPSLNTVVRHFGSLGNAVRAAGLEARQPGEHGAPTRSLRSHNLFAIAAERAADHPPVDARVLGRRITVVAHARRQPGEPHLRAALIDLAAAALRWADDLG